MKVGRMGRVSIDIKSPLSSTVYQSSSSSLTREEGFYRTHQIAPPFRPALRCLWRMPIQSEVFGAHKEEEFVPNKLSLSPSVTC
jgi:hypothetical protein